MIDADVRKLAVAAIRAKAAYLQVLEQLLVQTNPVGITLTSKLALEQEIERIAADPDPTIYEHDFQSVIALAQGQKH